MERIFAAYESLRDEVVIQAVKDYEDALKLIARTPPAIRRKRTFKNGCVPKRFAKYEQACKMASDCERFFRSQWFYELLNFNGEDIIRRVRAKVYNDKKTIPTEGMAD